MTHLALSQGKRVLFEFMVYLLESDFPNSIYSKTRERVHMLTNKVSPEAETKVQLDNLPHDLPEDFPSDDNLPTYEVAIQMSADYIKTPCDDNYIVQTTSSWGNVRSANDFYNDDSSSKNNSWQKCVITLIILCSLGLIILFLLFL